MWKFLLAALAALIALLLIIGGQIDLTRLNLQLPTPWFGVPTKAIDVRLWPANFTFSATSPLNLVMDNISLSNFTGTVLIDFTTSRLTFRPTGSQSEFRVSLVDIELGTANLTRLEFSNTKLESATLIGTGDIEIDGFSGTVAIINTSLRLTGNVTKIVIKTDNSSWELK